MTKNYKSHASILKKSGYSVVRRCFILATQSYSGLWTTILLRNVPSSHIRLPTDEIVAHITRFVAGIWQIHPFGEGNTRTIAVFAIQYLRSLGFDVDSEVFALHSWYFCNALVRANYKSAIVDYEFKFLERFFRNLLLGEQHELKNRDMLINAGEQISKSL